MSDGSSPTRPPVTPQPPRPRSTAIAQPLIFSIVAICFILIGVDRAELFPPIQPVVATLYRWFVLLSAFGLLVGVANVFYVHLQRVALGQTEWGYSLALVAAGIATLVAGLLQPTGVTSPMVEWFFDAILAPGMATLYALTIFFMAAAAFRYLRITVQGGSWMLAGTLLMLLAQMPASQQIFPPALGNLLQWLLDVPVMATLRGALLGSALALFLVGIRFILGRKQP